MVTTALASGICAGGGQNRGAAEAVADQDRGRFSGLAQMVGGPHEIGDVGGEGGVGEIAFAGAEAGEVEPQHRDAFGRQRRPRCAWPPARPCRR